MRDVMDRKESFTNVAVNNEPFNKWFEDHQKEIYYKFRNKEVVSDIYCILTAKVNINADIMAQFEHLYKMYKRSFKIMESSLKHTFNTEESVDIKSLENALCEEIDWLESSELNSSDNAILE